MPENFEQEMKRRSDEEKKAIAELVEKLFAYVPAESRCPHLKKDSTSPYCAKALDNNSEINGVRRMICDITSLQLWCLDRYHNCIFYKGEKFPTE